MFVGQPMAKVYFSFLISFQCLFAGCFSFVLNVLLTLPVKMFFFNV